MLALMFFIGAIVGIALGIIITMFCAKNYLGKDILETKKRKKKNNENTTDSKG